MRDAAHELATSSARVSSPSIEEAYVLPQFGDWPFAFTRIDAIYVWTQGGNQVGRKPDDYQLFLADHEQDVNAWEAFFELFDLSTTFERQSRDERDRPLQTVLDPQPSLETLVSERDGTNTTFRKFLNEQQQFGSTFGLPQPPSWKTINHYFWNEHLAGAALVMVGTVPTIQLQNRVSQNGTVSTLDIGIAFLLTWIWLIGIFALVIGLL